MNGSTLLYKILDQLDINYQYYAHPPAPTVAEASKYWKDIEATHCKNLFFRNHKGNRHYLVILEHTRELNIPELEKRLRQGKLSFASEKRMMKYLGVSPGSVTPFGLINDKNHHVHLFLDKKLKESMTISFHPCINTASIVIKYEDFIRFLDYCGNSYEYVEMYNN